MENKVKNCEIVRTGKNLQERTMSYLLALKVDTRNSFLFNNLQYKVFEIEKSSIIGRGKRTSNYANP